ncbi:MAG: DUF835 domain-containing protein [Nanoarchaeota archaeon]|nr:DUF835 domain-containing protein [Nanoarchaeota archaeon]
MVSASIIGLLSAIISIFAILIASLIFRKVYQEDYKKPWLYIGISVIFIGLSQLIRFLSGFYGLSIVNSSVSEAIAFILEFIAITIMAYGLILEYFILEYFKGKFVKMKLIPVQEGSLGGEIDLNVSNGNSYLALKKERDFIFNQFSDATRKGFEGFLISEDSPKFIRNKYNLEKTPLVWLSQIQAETNSSYLKESLDERSEMADPLQLNNLISYVDSFLEQSQNPFIVIELNLILKINNPAIVFEFLKYVCAKVKKFNGILICMLNVDVLSRDNLNEIRDFLIDLE